ADDFHVIGRAAARPVLYFPTRRSSDLASSGIGISTTISPVVAAASASSERTSSAPMMPVVRTPRATIAAPVNVAISTTTSGFSRSEEHTSELQSRFDLVCRLLLEHQTA